MTESSAPVTRVALIGCGLIGALWDLESDGDGLPRTHAGAFSSHKDCKLIAVCDSDLAKAERVGKHWQAAGIYSDVTQMFAEQAVDIAVVASSSSVRSAVIEAALAANVGTLVIEKPLALSLDESEKIAAAIHTKQCKSVVNYFRRWDPALQDLAKQLASGTFGPIQRMIGYYGKGLNNNGSHMLDLAAHLCQGTAYEARALGQTLGEAESDWSQGQDPALDAQIRFHTSQAQSIQLDMLATDQRAFTMFELRVLCERGILDILHGGRKLQITPLVADPVYPGYTILGIPEALESKSRLAMQAMAREALDLAQGKRKSSRCDVDSALLTARTVEAIRQSAHHSGEWRNIVSTT